jgi:hypothetical protein
VSIGHPGGFTATWTSAAAIEAFLPGGGTPKVFTQNYNNPLVTSAGVLASQILGLTLNVDYSCAGVFFTLGLTESGFCYGNSVISSADCGSKFAGITVDSFLVLANKVVSGQIVVFRGAMLKPGHINETATCLNELYDGCDPFASLGESIADKYSWMPSAASDEEIADESTLPVEFGLDQNYPNPFNPTTQISFSLPKATHVTIEIFNVMGQRVSILSEGNREAGVHMVEWDGNNVSSGVYFYRLTTPEFVQTKKMLLMK